MTWFGNDLRKVHWTFDAPPWVVESGKYWDASDQATRFAEAAVGAVELYCKDHHGLAYFDTELGRTFGKDLLGDFLPEAHARGMKVIAYYSCAFDVDVWQRFPEWRCLTADGKPAQLPNSQFVQFYPGKYVCLNSPYRQMVLGQLRELATNYEIDGYWLDIFHWVQDFELDPYGECWDSMYALEWCYCGYCRRKFERRTGKQMPPPSAGRQERLELSAFFNECRTELLRECLAEIRPCRPEAAVGINNYISVRYLFPEGSHAPIQEMLDYSSIESYGPDFSWQSRVSRFQRGLGKPFEVISSGVTLPGWCGWTAKSSELLKIEAAVMAAHGGSTTVGVTPHPDGRLIGGQIEHIGEAFRWLRDREPWFLGTESVSDVALLWTDETLEREAALRGLHTTLLDAHCQFDITNRLDRLDRYRLVVLPDRTTVTSIQADLLREYVRRGGRLLAFGQASLLDEWGRTTGRFALGDVFGVDHVGQGTIDHFFATVDGSDLGAGLPPDLTFLSPAQHVALTTGQADIFVRYPQAEVTEETSILWHPTNPPLYQTSWPLIVENSYGDGRCVYVAGMVGEDIYRPLMYRRDMDPWLKLLATDLVRRLLPEPVLSTNAPQGVEVVLNRRGNEYVLHLINTYPGLESGRFLPEQGTMQLGGLKVWLNGNVLGKVQSAQVVPDGEPAKLIQEDGWHALDLPPLEDHLAFAIE